MKWAILVLFGPTDFYLLVNTWVSTAYEELYLFDTLWKWGIDYTRSGIHMLVRQKCKNGEVEEPGSAYSQPRARGPNNFSKLILGA